MKVFVVSGMSPTDAELIEVTRFPFTRNGRNLAEYIMRNYEALGIPARVDVRES